MPRAFWYHHYRPMSNIYGHRARCVGPISWHRYLDANCKTIHSTNLEYADQRVICVGGLEATISSTSHSVRKSAICLAHASIHHFATLRKSCGHNFQSVIHIGRLSEARDAAEKSSREVHEVFHSLYTVAGLEALHHHSYILC